MMCIEKGDGLFEQILPEEQEILFESQIPSDERLEKKADSLAEELLDDAKNMLDKAKDKTTIDENGNEVEADTIKEKKYVASVLGVVTKMVQGKQTIKLKKKEEARNEASFLMDLLKKAQSGQMSEKELAALEEKSNG